MSLATGCSPCRRALRVAALLIPLAGAVSAARTAEVSTLMRDVERLLVAPRSSEAPGPLIRQLLAGRPLQEGCLSPLLLASLTDGSREAASALAGRPSLPSERTWSTASGPFRIYYTQESGSPHALADDDGAPSAYLEEVEEALADAYALLVDELGFLAPAGMPYIEVYLADPGPGVRGYVVPQLAGGSPADERRGGFMVLGNRLSDVPAEATHQLAHLVLLGYSYREPVWWHEATASWATLLARGRATEEIAAIHRVISTPERGLGGDDLTRMRGSLLFPTFLSLTEEPPTTVRAIWEECGALSGDNLLDAIDHVARREGRGSWEDVLRAFYASWIADAAGRSRLTAALGATLPEPGLAAEVTDYPVAGVPETGPIAPLGASFLHFHTLAGARGGLSLTVVGEQGSRWDVLLLVRRGPEGAFQAVSVPMDAADQGRIRFPWGSISDSLLMLVNIGEQPEPSRFSFWARHRHTIPFDLLDFRADPADGGILLQWTTDSEADLQGWTLYRSSHPSRGFERLSRIPIPAGGSDQGAATYTFLDDSVGRGRKAYYYLEAITIQGFTETTQVIGAYPGPRGARHPAAP